MDVCGVVSNQSFPCFSQSCNSSKELRNVPGSVVMNRMRVSTGFYDQGHLQYYCKSSKNNAVMTTSEKKVKKMEKKKLKLLKGLTKDLSAFSGIGFGLDSEAGLGDQVQGSMISEASELLLKQLQKLKAEKKEQKQKKKEEKIRLKAIKMQNRLMGGNTSSSSSSESSSDSECGEVINMNSLKTSQANKIAMPQIVGESVSPVVPPIMPVLPSLQSLVSESSQLSLSDDQIAKQGSCVSLSENSRNSLDTSCSKRIEVCMGGKCKKSGAAELLDKFQSVVGIEGSVSGCKCMGKCRDGPNVKVVDGGLLAENSVRSPSNPLCIGVGLEDVDMIVANFLGDNRNQLEFAV